MELVSPKILISFNPSTGEKLAEIVPDSSKDVSLKVKRADDAQDNWKNLRISQRLESIRRLHDILSRESERIANNLSVETGRPLQESLGAEILPTLRGLQFLCKSAPALLKPIRAGSHGMFAYAEPYGVVAVIGTWNYPLYLNIITICQALAAGNTVVWKPSELAIHSALEIEKLFELAGFPDGVVEIVYGDAEAGRLLTRADCDKYVFTGGVQSGRSILAELAKSGKPSVMELSGNDAFIVCMDAPLELAARSAVWGRVSNAGQSCIAPQRFYVVQSIYESFLNRLRVHLEALRLCELTPLRTEPARQRCHHLVREAVEHGARLLVGGEFDTQKPGFHYTPVLLADCNDSMSVMKEDLFAPVITVCPVMNEHEAVLKANSNPMGLGASVWTNDIVQGKKLASQLKVGMVSINDVLMDASHPEVSFGGVRSSGFGKLRGAQGIAEFVVRKVVAEHSVIGFRRHLFPYFPSAAELLKSAATIRGAGGWRSVPNLIRSAIAWQRQFSAFKKKTGENKP